MRYDLKRYQCIIKLNGLISFKQFEIYVNYAKAETLLSDIIYYLTQFFRKYLYI